MRRVEIKSTEKIDGKVVAKASGLAGEDFDAEVYQLHGFSSSPGKSSESVVIEMNGDADNFVVLPPGGLKEAEAGTTVIYYGDTEIVLNENSVKIKANGNFLNIENGKLDTDLDINTTGKIHADGKVTSNDDVKAQSISLRNHKHRYNWTDPGGSSTTSSPS